MRQSRQIFLKKPRDIYTFADTKNLCSLHLRGGSEIIQLRVKNLPENIIEERAGQIVTEVRKFSSALIIFNDLPDLAIKLGADGIHVGQDSDFKSIIKNVPDSMIVGVSVDTPQEAVEAEEAGATYVGAGAVYKTATKPEAPAIGPEQLKKIVQAVSIPVVAIGGINLTNLITVLNTGVHFIAVISAINDAEDIETEIRKFRKIIKDIK